MKLTGTIRKHVEAPENEQCFYKVEDQVTILCDRDNEHYYRVRYLDGYSEDLPESWLELDPEASGKSSQSRKDFSDTSFTAYSTRSREPPFSH